MKTIAVLCVGPRSHYYSIQGIEIYDQQRDARSYTGPHPAVAHPPCRGWSTWTRHQAHATQEEKALGPWCINVLDKWGGILEHPAQSHLHRSGLLPLPGQPINPRLWTIEVPAHWWGDRRTKATWLTFFHIHPKAVNWPLRLEEPGRSKQEWNRMSRNTRSRTPLAMAVWLIETARHATP